MNPPNSPPGNNLASPYYGPDPMARYMFPNGLPQMFDPAIMMSPYYYSPEMQPLLKWRAQMMQFLRTQNTFANQSMAIAEMMGNPNSMMMFQNHQASQRQRDSPMMPQLGHITTKPIHSTAIGNPTTIPFDNSQGAYLRQGHRYDPSSAPLVPERKKDAQRQLKQKEVIIIDEDDVVDEVMRGEKVERNKAVDTKVSLTSLQSMKITRSKEGIPILKSVKLPNVYQKKHSKSTVIKTNSEEKMEEESFKPGDSKIRKIRKRQYEGEGEKPRYNQSERERREIKSTSEQKSNPNRGFDQQGKIIMSGLHQARITELRSTMTGEETKDEIFGNQKQSKKLSLLSRLQFEGSLLHQSCKDVQLAIPTFQSRQILGVVRQKAEAQKTPNRRPQQRPSQNRDARSRVQICRNSSAPKSTQADTIG